MRISDWSSDVCSSDLAALGINDCVAFDVQAVCSGFLYALSVADSMMKGGMTDKALVIGEETFSRILDWEDRTTCHLFGHGQGAVVLDSPTCDRGTFVTRLPAAGRSREMFVMSRGPLTHRIQRHRRA